MHYKQRKYGLAFVHLLKMVDLIKDLDEISYPGHTYAIYFTARAHYDFFDYENAIKYGKQHGTIEASFYNVDGKQVLIDISDDGAGIAEEHLGRVFERFYRTDLARSRKVGGSGLGLSICKHIIEAHGQSIHVRSKIDVGTTIGFTLHSKKN